MPRSVNPAGSVMLTLTVAVPPAGTSTLGALNDAVANADWYEMVWKLVACWPPVASAATCDRSSVTAEAPVFRSVSVLTCGPACVSPSASLPGSTPTVACTEPTMSTMPAPCRCTLSRIPNAALPHQFLGSAEFCSNDFIAFDEVPGRACSTSAAAPATCGDAIDVPLLLPKPPSSSGI